MYQIIRTSIGGRNGLYTLKGHPMSLNLDRILPEVTQNCSMVLLFYIKCEDFSIAARYLIKIYEYKNNCKRVVTLKMWKLWNDHQFKFEPQKAASCCFSLQQWKDEMAQSRHHTFGILIIVINIFLKQRFFLFIQICHTQNYGIK